MNKSVTIVVGKKDIDVLDIDEYYPIGTIVLYDKITIYYFKKLDAYDLFGKPYFRVFEFKDDARKVSIDLVVTQIPEFFKFCCYKIVDKTNRGGRCRIVHEIEMNKHYNGELFAYNISENLVNKTRLGDQFPLEHSGQACAQNLIGGVERRNQPQLLDCFDCYAVVFKFNNHFFIPLRITDWKLAYFAFEQRQSLNSWVFCTNYLRLTKKEEARNYFVGIDSKLHFDNILGISYTKFARQIEVNPKDGTSIHH